MYYVIRSTLSVQETHTLISCCLFFQGFYFILGLRSFLDSVLRKIVKRCINTITELFILFQVSILLVRLLLVSFSKNVIVSYSDKTLIMHKWTPSCTIACFPAL